MRKGEFQYWTGVYVTDEQYSFIEKEYMRTLGLNPYEFCMAWLRNGGIDRLIRWVKEQYDIERMKNKNGENQHT